MRPKIPIGAELERQIRAARAAEARDRADGRRASAVAYDPTLRRVIVDLTNGIRISFPLTVFPEVARAPASALKKIVLSPSGSGFEWSALDADYSVPGLLAWAAGTHASARALGGVGGRVRSAAKTMAARANGAHGGRPRAHRKAGQSRHRQTQSTR